MSFRITSDGEGMG